MDQLMDWLFYEVLNLFAMVFRMLTFRSQAAGKQAKTDKGA